MNTLDELIAYCNQNERVCPQPRLWNELWNKLKDKKQINSGWHPPLPLILAAWWDASPSTKQLRLIEHLTWAKNHEQLKEISNYLTSLAEDQWFHFYD